MKIVFVLLSGLLSGSLLYAACNGPYCWDDTGANIRASVTMGGPTSLLTGTSAVIQARSGDPVGSLAYCTDCGAVRLCVSTGTAVAAYTIVTATTTKCQ